MCLGGDAQQRARSRQEKTSANGVVVVAERFVPLGMPLDSAEQELTFAGATAGAKQHVIDTGHLNASSGGSPGRGCPCGGPRRDAVRRLRDTGGPAVSSDSPGIPSNMAFW